MFKKLNHNGNNFEFPDNEKGKKDYEAFIAKFPDAIEVAIAPDPDKEGKETPSQEIESAPVEESVALEPTVTDSKPVAISSDLPKIKTGTVADTSEINKIKEKTSKELEAELKTINDRIALIAGKDMEIDALDSPNRIKEFNELSIEKSKVLRNLGQETNKGEGVILDLFNDLKEAAVQGYSRGDVVDPSFKLFSLGGDASDQQVIDLINAKKDVASKAMQSDEMRAFDETYEKTGGGFLGFMLGAAENPSIVPAMLISSVATQIGTVTKSEDARQRFAQGVIGGGVIGSSIPVIGTAAGAIGGGFFAAAGTMETALTFADLLEEEVGGELTVDNVRSVLEDPVKLEDLQNRALGRGLAIATIETATGALAKGVGSTLVKKGFTPIAVTGAAASLDIVGGGVGEVAGMTLAKQPYDIKEIGFEMITPGFSSAIGLASLKNITELTNQSKVNNIIKPTEYTNISYAFNPAEQTTEAQINIAKIPGSENILDRNVKREISKGNITQEQGDAIKLNFRDTQSAVNQIKPLKLVEQDQAIAVQLIKEKKQLKNQIEQVGEPSLTTEQSDRIKQIDEDLKGIGSKAVTQQVEKIREAAKDITDLDIQEFATTAETEAFLSEQDQDIKASAQQGFIIQNKDGKQTIVINREIADKEIAVEVPAHEFLHAILYKTVKDSPATALQLGNSLMEYISKIDINQVKDSNFAQRLQQYQDQPTEVQAEEALTLFSDAILTGDIKFKENIFTKLRDVISKILQVGGVKARFDTGRDVYNFIRDYNKNIQEGKLTSQQIRTAEEGVKLDIQDQAVKQAETVIKESRSEEASNKVQEIYEQKGINGALDIIEQFKPITNKIVDQRKNAPNFDRQLLTDEIETGAGGILDLIQAYDPASNVPLAAYINKYLPVRAITASRRVLGEEFIDDITESVQVAAEAAPEVEIEVAETKPTERLIEVKKQVLSESNQKELEDIVAEKLPELTPDQFTFKTLPNWAKQTLAKEIDIPVKKFEGSSNFTQAELNRVISFIENNIDTVRKALPDAAVLEGAPVSEGLIGTATGVPNNLLKDTNLYTRLERGTKKAGLVPFQKNKGIDNRSVLKAIGVIEGTRTAGPRDKQAQTAKGIINVLAKFITNQEIRKQADLTPQQKTDIETGKGSRLLFSKADKNKFDEIFKDAPQEVLKYGMLLNVKPTNKAINSVLDKIEEELPIDVYDEYFEKYFKPFIEFRKFAQKQKWPWAEEKVKNTLITLRKNNPDLKLKNIKLNKDSQQIDVQFEQDGKLVLVEVKKNYQARISQIYLYEEADGKISTNKTADKIYEDEIIEADKTRNVLIDRIYRDYEKYVEKTTDKNNRVQYIVPIFAIEKARESLKKDKIAYETTIKMPIGLAVSLYNTKANKAKNAKGLLISFGDLGTFYIGENKMQFPVPSFEQEGMGLTVRIMDRYNPRQNPIVVDGEKFAAASLSRIAVNTLTPEAVKVLENTPSLSLQNETQARAILKFSKSKTEAAVKNNLELPKSQRLPKDSTNKQVLAKMQELDNEANKARIKYSKSQNLDEAFNDIIEAKTGIETYKRFSPAKATVRGASKGKFNFFIPPNAEDFTGLLYKTLAKGKLGDRQMQWYKDNLLDPYARAMNDISAARVAMFEDYKALKEDLEIIPKDLKKKSVDEYTREQAVRVYVWNSQGNNIPGLFKTDQKELVDYVNNDPELRLFAEQLIAIQKTDGYSAPKEGWLTGSITTDLLDNVNSIKRKKYLEQWQNNVDEIFSEVNMNKLEAAFGKPYRKALENILTRMKTGRNKPSTSDLLAGRVTDWLNNSVGAIMFFNTRSAVLQTISSINFINWSDNNIYQAGKAFANQPQYWKDFKFLFNSDFLKERRGGSRFNVAESEIADAAKKGGARGVISKILQAGFLPTQVADSFAIASGGATFYRNRVKSYLKETDADGNKIYTEAEAQEKAFLDFREIAEESQQSSRPDRISAQQAGPLGRTILAFANTPAQYARLTKKAASDLINGRGDAKTNFSKLLYYGFVQNLIFNMLQKATFLLAFGDEDEDEKKKEKAYLSTINGMADGLLRGIGVGGAAISTIKNVLIKISEDAADPVSDVLDFSPPISSKYDKLQRAYRTYKWNKEEIKEKGFSLNSPAYGAAANIISATVNVPLDRVVRKVNNVVDATQENITPLERAMLAAGWSEWELGIQKPKEVKPKKKKKSKFKRVRKGDR